MTRTKQWPTARICLIDWGCFWSRLATKTLPVEILEVIVDQVVSETTLHSLLTISKTMFAIASKALYRDPAGWKLNDDKLNSLVDMLLAHSLADDDDTNLCRELRGIQKISSKPYANYLAMIRVYDFSETELVRTRFYGALSVSHRVVWEFGPLAELIMEHHRKLGKKAAVGWMCNTITSAALYGNLSNIRQLSIIGDFIQQYLDLVPSMASLQDVAFNLHRESVGTQDQVAHYQMALKFVEQFTQHHGRRQLKTIKFVNLPSWNPHLDECLEIETRIQQMVGPPTNTTTINGTNWSTFLSFADILDLSSVKRWDQTSSSKCVWETVSQRWPNLTPQSIFQRCRSLEQIGTWLDDPDVFKWAVKEQVSHKSIGQPQTLVPLQALSCVCRNDIMETICDDIIQAFGETLEILNIFPRNGGEVISEWTIGGQWRSAPVLQAVSVNSVPAIVIHPDAFKATPALEQLCLRDSGRIWVGSQEVGANRLLSIWDLPKLHTLHLEGHVADNLDPRSFARMPALKIVSLTGNVSNNRAFLPSPGSAADLQRHLWTWDIALPQLTTLTLMGHHAIRFRFRFVLLCPNLAFLGLHARGHRVFLSDDLDIGLDEDTLNASGGQQEQGDVADYPNNDNNNNNSGDNINNAAGATTSHPSTLHHRLRNLVLNGRYVVSDEALTFLLTRLFPLLSSLTMTNCKRYTIEKLVELSEAHRRLDNVITSRQLTTRHMRALQLERPRRIPRRYRTTFQSTEIDQWYCRLEKEFIDTVYHGDASLRPTPHVVDGRSVEMLGPYCIYQMGRSRNFFRRARNV